MNEGGVIAIIPARGGSKGVPRKNLRLFAGRPLIEHSIADAMHAKSVTRTVVSTDDAEIAEIAHRAGAEVIDRPAALATDQATSESALLHAVEWLAANGSPRPELIVFLQAASPIRDSAHIDDAVAQLRKERADSLVSVTPSHDFHWTLSEGHGVPVNYNPSKRPRRQDMRPQFRENGSLYVMKAAGLVEHGCRLFGRVARFEMGLAESFQIDTIEDFEVAEALFQKAHRRSLHAELAKVGLIVFDFDGVFTDNKVLVMQDGTEGVLCNRSDGLGFGMLAKAGIPALVLSKEVNPVVSARCRKLKLECRQGIDDKLTELKAILAARGLKPGEVVYVGNDLNDIECMSHVGVPIAVADAYPQVRAVARAVTRSNGGEGAVREVIEWLIEARQAGGRGDA